MSATTELLLEQIERTQEALRIARETGDEVALVSLQLKLNNLREAFSTSSFALNEGKAVLKG